MRTDLSDQVRTYAEHLESLVDDWEIDDLFYEHDFPPILPGRRQPSWRRGPLIAVGTAAVILIVGAAMILLRGDSPVADDVVSSPVELHTLEVFTQRDAAVAWSPDGKLLVTAVDGIANVWNADTGEMLESQELDHIEGVTEVAWSPDGTRIATRGAGGVHDANTGEELVVPLPEFLSFSPDGSRIAVGGAWGGAAILDANTGDVQLMLPFSPSWVFAAAWSPDGARLASTFGTDIKVWDSGTGEELVEIPRAFIKVTDVAWSPDGRWIAAASRDGQSIRVFDALSGGEYLSLAGHASGVWAVVWSPDSARIASASADGTAKIWDADSGDELATIAGHTDAVTDVAWSPNGTRIATASADGSIKIWNVD